MALVHHLPCGECERCDAGHESTCERFATETIVPGGFAERVLASGGWVELPDTATTRAGPPSSRSPACFAAPSACPRGRVLIVGHGFVGRLFAAVLAARGDEVFAVDADPARTLREPDGPVGAVVLCAPGGARHALAALEPGGTLLVFADAGVLPADAALPPRADRRRQPLGDAGPHARGRASSCPELDVPAPTVLPLDRFAEGLELQRTRSALKVVFVAVRALRFHGPGDVRLEDVPRPEPGPGEVLRPGRSRR